MRDPVPKTTDAQGPIHYNAPHSDLYSALNKHLRKRHNQISKIYSSRTCVPRSPLTRPSPEHRQPRRQQQLAHELTQGEQS